MRRALVEQDHAKWIKMIRDDAASFPNHRDQLEAIADSLEHKRPNAVTLKLIHAIPHRVQDAVIPSAALAYLVRNRTAYMKATMTTKLTARLARVRSVLARIVTANTANLDVLVTMPDTNGNEGERTYNVTVDASGSYEKFVDDMLAKLTKATGGHEVSLENIEESGSQTPLRLYLEAVAPVKHEATGLFYDEIETMYRWNNWDDIKALSARTYGFANTPWEWDYYKNADALLMAYGDTFIDDDEMHEGDERSQAAHVWEILKGNDNNITRRNQLVSGDYFIVRQA